jgi:hypothetical protein
MFVKWTEQWGEGGGQEQQERELQEVVGRADTR